jgi:hypothetical protein
MIGNDIAVRYYQQTNDPNRLRTVEATLINWINGGQLLLALVRPDSSSQAILHTLLSGSAQGLPTGALRLLDVTRCVDPVQDKHLSTVSLVDRHALDSTVRNWHSATASNVIRHYVYDNRLPRVFYVYPPAKAGARLELFVSTVPTKVNVLTDQLSVPDTYLDAMLEYCLFRYYSYDTEYSQNPELANGRFKAMQVLLGVKLTRDLALSPDMNTKGAAPTTGAASGGV